ncbi:MAG: hypothetical protein MJK12_15175 [Colwellia sp.]|nr:hypothetical protein [Colwellia sp.]
MVTIRTFIMFKVSLMIIVVAHLIFSSLAVNASTLAEQLIDLSELQYELVDYPNVENEYVTNTISNQKTLRITVSELRDNSGLIYLGGLVSKAELAAYLTELKLILGDKFQQYRSNQSQRDHGMFHLTIINPSEYQFIDKAKITLGEQYSVTLLGLGKVAKSRQESYFVVAQSPDAQLFRQQNVLSLKDFHITLGFFPQDIYGVKKDKSTLLKKVPKY